MKFNLALVTLAVLLTSGTQAADLKYLKTSPAKTFKDAETLCASKATTTSAWRLPKQAEFLIALYKLSESDKTLISFALDVSASRKVYYLWTQGNDLEQTQAIRDKNTILFTLADGNGTDLEIFDMDKNLKEMNEQLAQFKSAPANFPDVSPEMLKIGQATLDTLNQGLTVFCVK